MFLEISQKKFINFSIILIILFDGLFFSINSDRYSNLKSIITMRIKELQANLAYIPKNNPNQNNNISLIANTANTLLAVKNIFGGEISYINDTTSTTTAKSIPVLVYHGIPAESENNVPISIFIDQMKTLKIAGWRTVNISDFYKFLRGEIILPDKSFLLTFDDGRKDTYYPADPVLKDLGFNAVMFVITNKSLPTQKVKESTYYLSQVELQSMQNSGRWDIESHGEADHDWYKIDNNGNTGHFLSNKLWLTNQNRLETDEEFKNRIIADLINSKKTIEEEFEKPVIAFAFPFSDYGEDSINFGNSVKIIYDSISTIYPMAFYQSRTSDGDTFNYPSNSFMVKRTEPLASWNGEKLLQVLEDGKAKNLPYLSDNLGPEWISTWGNYSSTTEGLEISPTASSTGADIFLDGSYLWNNYLFNVDAKWNTGSSISIVTRRVNNDDYLACVFSSNRIFIKEQSSTSSIIVSDLISDKPIIKNNSGNISMKINNNTAECIVNGEVKLANKKIPTTYSSGGIGIQVWNPITGYAKAVIKKVQVNSL